MMTSQASQTVQLLSAVLLTVMAWGAAFFYQEKHDHAIEHESEMHRVESEHEADPEPPVVQECDVVVVTLDFGDGPSLLFSNRKAECNEDGVITIQADCEKDSW